MQESGIAKAVRLADGNQSKLARILRCTPQCVQRWVELGRPSLSGCRKIVAAFPGKITAAELLPETYGPAAADGA
jgi:DNA-binding transcriptional regulator YdaS (Cro superfamily)